MDEIVFVSGLFGWHFVVGAVLGYGALRFYEISVEHGAAFSLIFTVSVVLTEQWFGSTFIEVPWPMLKNGIIASILGGSSRPGPAVSTTC